MVDAADENGRDDLDFESAVKELEALVDALESGDLSLADSLSRFERGVELSRHCHTLLEQARQTVTVLLDPDDPGSERPLDPERGDDETQPPT